MPNRLLESLEPRVLPAFTAAVRNHVLVVACDGVDDQVTMTWTYRVEDGAITGLQRVLVEQYDGSDTPGLAFAASKFDSIRVAMGDGEDTFLEMFTFVDADEETVDPPAFDADGVPQRPLTVDGGADNDVIFAGPCRETLIGGDGSDQIESGGNADRIDAGDGNDIVLIQFVDGNLADPRTVKIASNAVVTIVGGAGDDDIAAELEEPNVLAMRVDAGAGADSVVGSTRADVIDGGEGDDYASGGSGDDTITGSAGGDTITGGGGRNRLFGGGGNDRLNGSGGRDFLYAGDGDDRLYGNGGNDNIDGGGGKDRIYGGDGDDLLIGGGSVDRLYGDAGSDTLIGGKSNDYLFGDDGTDHALSRDAGDVLDSIESLA